MIKKESLILVVLLFVAAMVIFGCAQQEQTSVTSVPLIISNFPHEDGNQWESTFSVVYGTTEVSSRRITREFNGTTTLENGLIAQNLMVSWGAVSSTVSMSGASKTFAAPWSFSLYYVSANGVYDYGEPTNPTTEATMVIPLPLQVGDTWTISGRTHEAIAEEEVTVPAGTFNTIKVAIRSWGNSEPDEYEWYAEGVGLVKSYTWFVAADINNDPVEGSFNEELVSKNF